MIFFLTLRYTVHGGVTRRRTEDGGGKTPCRNMGVKRAEDREEGNIRCLISIRAQRIAREQEEEPEEEQEVEGPGQGASVCESAVEGTEREEAREKEE